MHEEKSWKLLDYSISETVATVLSQPSEQDLEHRGIILTPIIYFIT